MAVPPSNATAQDINLIVMALTPSMSSDDRASVSNLFKRVFAELQNRIEGMQLSPVVISPSYQSYAMRIVH